MKLGSTYTYDPEIKEQLKEWRRSGSLHSKKFKTQKSSSKVLAPVFWDRDGILLVDYVGKAKSYYITLLEKTEAATGLQTTRQAFERNPVSS
jgi:hypothetical protein